MKTRMMALLFLLCFSFPFSAFSNSDYLMDVESKILSGDLNGAYELFTSGTFIIKNPQLYYKVSNEVETVLRFCSESAKFNKAIASGNENLALAHFKSIKFLHDKLPPTLHFSEKLSQVIEASYKGTSEKHESIVAKLAAQRAADKKEYGALQNETGETWAKIEAKIMVKDYNGAREILKTSPVRQDRRLYMLMEDELDRVIDYSEAFGRFNALASARGKEAAAIANFESLMSYYNALPDTISFSPKFVSLLNGSIESAERYVKKECGGDYKKILVGMTLSRVQKCYGEFFLTGQVQRNGSTVSEYRRGNGHVVGNDFLYVSNGKIMAWEKF